MRTLLQASLLLAVAGACGASPSAMVRGTGPDAGVTGRLDATADAVVDARRGEDASDALDAPSMTHEEGGFDQDPIVFVHGLGGSAENWSTAIPFFMKAGYPSSYLRAISYSDPNGSNVPDAMELETFVDGVLADLHVDKVDMVVHSMGSISSRYYIKLLGGNGKVRDYVSLAGVVHGNDEACPFPSNQGSIEMCPSYPTDTSTVVGMIDGVTGSGGDDTPFSVDDADGGSIYYSGLWSNFDLVVTPGESECLFQKSVKDCSSPHDTEYMNLEHNDFLTDSKVLAQVLSLVKMHSASSP